MTVAAPPAVLILWWIAAVLTAVVIVPVAVYLLHRLWLVARDIRRFSAGALRGAEGIESHVGRLGALDRTLELGGSLVERGAALERASAEVAEILAERA